jgi:hypothetical protein
MFLSIGNAKLGNKMASNATDLKVFAVITLHSSGASCVTVKRQRSPESSVHIAA